MKKVIAISIVLMIVFSLSLAFAAIPDIKSLSVDELHQLQAEIMEELGARKEVPSFTAPTGVYEAGVDFPVGKYVITSPDYCTYITLYASMTDYNNGKKLASKDTVYNGDEKKVVAFTEGMVVFVDFNIARFEPFTGLVFE